MDVMTLHRTAADRARHAEHELLVQARIGAFGGWDTWLLDLQRKLAGTAPQCTSDKPQCTSDN
jgi:hypothetical protein